MCLGRVPWTSPVDVSRGRVSDVSRGRVSEVSAPPCAAASAGPRLRRRHRASRPPRHPSTPTGYSSGHSREEGELAPPGSDMCGVGVRRLAGGLEADGCENPARLIRTQLTDYWREQRLLCLH